MSVPVRAPAPSHRESHEPVDPSVFADADDSDKDEDYDAFLAGMPDTFACECGRWTWAVLLAGTLQCLRLGVGVCWVTLTRPLRC